MVRSVHNCKAWLAVGCISVVLAACGGGGGSSPSGSSQVGTPSSSQSTPTTGQSTPTTGQSTPTTGQSTPTQTPITDVPTPTQSVPITTYLPPLTSQSAPTANQNSVKAECTACGALDDNTYRGSGTGIWTVSNTGTVAADYPVAISNIKGQKVTLLFTNESSAAVTMPGLALSSMVSPLTGHAASDVSDPQADARARISEFNRNGLSRYGQRSNRRQSLSVAPSSPSFAAAVGDSQSIYLYDETQRTVTLMAQQSTSDGNTVRIWVDPSEYGSSKVSSAIVSQLLTAYATPKTGIYDMLVAMGGPVWGNSAYSNVIAANVPIDLFVVNFDNNHTPYGLVGYFWSGNNFLKEPTGDLAYSNQSLSLYLDSETMYLGGSGGMPTMLSATAHESMHMQNFYRRAVLHNAPNDTWLEEMTAMMFEDWVSLKLLPSFSELRDGRMPSYLNWNGHGAYDCSITTWAAQQSDCDSYSLNGSFGGYLNRQLGIAFYQGLLYNFTGADSATVLDKEIKNVRSSSSLGREFSNFVTTTVGLVPASASLPTFSFAARTENTMFSLIGIDPATLSVYRSVPTAVPATLYGLASYPVFRSAVTGTYAETVRVPPGTRLTVVIE